MSTAVKNPPVKAKVNVGVPRTIPRGSVLTIVLAMSMSALCYFLAWAVGESKTEKMARLWRLRASMAWTFRRLQNDITATYLNARCGNGNKEINQNNPLLKRWIALFDEYQSVFVDLEIDSLLHNKPDFKRTP
jgi:hypothetical protein